MHTCVAKCAHARICGCCCCLRRGDERRRGEEKGARTLGLQLARLVSHPLEAGQRLHKLQGWKRVTGMVAGYLWETYAHVFDAI